MQSSKPVMKSDWFWISLFASFLLAISPDSLAQSDDDDEVLEEIIVLAEQFRDDSTSDVSGFDLAVLDTPQSISILGREVMDVTLSTSSIRASDYIAGLNVVRPAGGIDTDFRARGFIVSEVNGFRQNGFSMTHNFYPDTAALERIEFIKGVNSVRYGTNQPGGFVNYVFKTPTDEMKLRGKFIFGSNSFARAEVDAGGPMNEAGTIRMRMVAAHERDKTFLDVVDSDTTVLAPSFVIDINDQWQQRFYGYFQDFNTVPEAGVSLDNDGNFPDMRRETFTGQPWNRVENQNITVQSITTYRHNDNLRLDLGVHYNEQEGFRHYARPRNGVFTQPSLILRPSNAMESAVFTDGKGRQYIEVPAGTAVGYDIRRPAFIYNDDSGVNLRGTWEFQAWGHDQIVTAAVDSRRADSGSGRSSSGSRGSSRTFNLNSPDYGIPFNQTTINPSGSTKFESTAVSVMALLRPLENMSFLIGARTDDNSDKSYTSAGALSEDLKTEDETYTFGVTYGVVDNVNLYAMTGNTFSANPGVCDIDGNLLPPESGTMFEIGAKAELIDGNVLATVAYFDITREDVAQEDNFLDPAREFGCNNVGAWRTSGQEESNGFEIEVVGKLTDNWRIIASFAQVDSNITEDNNPAVIGRGTPNVPENSLQLFSTYTFDNGATVGAGVVYRDERPIALFPQQNFFNGYQRDPANPGIPLLNENGDPVAMRARVDAPMLPSDTVINVMASYPVTDNVEVGLNIDNLLDEEGWESGFSANTTGIKPLRPFAAYAYIDIEF